MPGNILIVEDEEKIARFVELELIHEVCGYDYLGETNVIDVYVRYLRAKIDDCFGVRVISTVRCAGYSIKEG